MKKTLFAFISFLLLISLGLSAKSIKQRMRERLPVIVKLKDQGIVGENNKGYLQYVGNKKEQTGVVNAENADRKQVYNAIAKKQGTSSSLVGARRAKQIAANAKSGYWLQKANGKWYKK